MTTLPKSIAESSIGHTFEIIHDAPIENGAQLIAQSSAFKVFELHRRDAIKPPPQPEPPQQTENEAWPEMDPAAYHGLAGEIVNTIDPHTESDKVAVLIQFLAAFGNVVGGNPYFQVEATKHRANLFVLLIGKSSKARKGTSMDRVAAFFLPADPTWPRPRGGLSSAEGLIMEVRDQIEKWDAKDKMFNIVDPGVTDKRCMLVESEFAAVLRNAERTGNKLSQTLRDAWDCKPLGSLTRSSPLKATNPHISIVGHITEEELRMNLTRTDMANGYANRQPVRTGQAVEAATRRRQPQRQRDRSPQGPDR